MKFLAAGEVAGVTYETFAPVVSAITGTISLSNIIAILAGAAGVAIIMVFGWWGVRKAAGMIMAAFKRGRLKI